MHKVKLKLSEYADISYIVVTVLYTVHSIDKPSLASMCKFYKIPNYLHPCIIVIEECLMQKVDVQILLRVEIHASREEICCGLHFYLKNNCCGSGSVWIRIILMDPNPVEPCICTYC